jgi:hypothetical protein
MLACAALAALTLGGFAPREARATFMTPPWPYRPKECTLIRKGTVFHLFYTRGSSSAPFDSTWRDLGHATSTDLIQWTEQPPVLPFRPSKWDNFQVWAPQVMLQGATYYMFYTGVTHGPPVYDHDQRIGLATSTDLFNWTRLDQPVFECAAVPWANCIPSQPGGGDCRDPFVVADPDSIGHWLMYYTTRPSAAPADFIVGLARSRGDLTQWFDGGPMWNTFATRTGSGVVETPDLIKHGSLWYLLYTTWLSHPIWIQTATTPVADSTHWSAPFSLYSQVVQIDTDPSFAPEHYTVDGHDLYLMPNSLYDSVQLLEYQWKTPPRFDLVEPYTTAGRLGVSDEAAGSGYALHAGAGRAGVRLWLDLPREEHGRCWVGDISGRRVRELGAGPWHAGRNELAWDGRDDRGDTAPSGVYLAVIETTLGRRASRFTLLR